MNPEKAIEILAYSIHRYPHILDDDTLDAIKLGIKALKLLEKRRHFAVPDRADLLPGETKD